MTLNYILLSALKKGFVSVTKAGLRGTERP